ncbi:MAG: DUF427 domain-containing protein [Candidatus Dojkabacteria bacterium]|nr:DUF427 domain-containing protein [Candidatus Dojkabacteria bacterium]
MKYTASWRNQTIAEADESEILILEGNVYYPKSSVNTDFLKGSDLHTTCPWKGVASYYSIEVNGELNENSAWYYPEPKNGSEEVVSEQNNGKYEGDFSSFVTFWNGVVVSETE